MTEGTNPTHPGEGPGPVCPQRPGEAAVPYAVRNAHGEILRLADVPVDADDEPTARAMAEGVPMAVALVWTGTGWTPLPRER